MNRRISKWMILLLVLVFLISACTPIENTDSNSDVEAYKSIIESLEEELRDLENRNQELEAELANREESEEKDEDVEDTSESNILLITALEVMEDIKNKDFDNLSNYVGEEGLLFSPYGYVDRESAIILSQEKVENLEDNNEEYEWGYYDGKGDPIILTFDNYYDEFIYDQDFLNSEIIGNNVRIGQGNSLENIHEVFEDAQFVEFHFTGFEEEFIGMDWASLRLVFTEDGDSWNLVAIVHDEWTI